MCENPTCVSECNYMPSMTMTPFGLMQGHVREEVALSTAKNIYNCFFLSLAIYVLKH